MIHYIYGETDIPFVEDVLEDVNRYINMEDAQYWELEAVSSSMQKKLQKKVEEINSKNAIDSNRPLGVRVGFLGSMNLLMKKVVRKLSRWYVSDVAEQQTTYNTLVSQYLNSELPMLAAMNRQILELKKEMKEMQCALPDKFYVDFENAFRGDEAVIQERLEKYVTLFKGKNAVVDLGCGRGEFLELMAKNGIPAKGVDSNALMVKECVDKGLAVEKGDVLAYLKGCKSGSLDGIFMGQLVEHLAAGKAYALIREAYRTLKKDGVLVAETINPLTLGVFSYSFYLDPTHRTPVHPAFMRFMAQSIGFEVAPIEFVDEFPDQYKLAIQESANEDLKKVVDQLNNQLYGAQDYYVVCKKNGVEKHEA